MSHQLRVRRKGFYRGDSKAAGARHVDYFGADSSGCRLKPSWGEAVCSDVLLWKLDQRGVFGGVEVSAVIPDI